jgi:replication-associated recombination protein RarA
MTILDLTPGVHTLITGPHASGKTTALKALAADAELAGHRVLAIDALSTARSIARQITAELEQAQPGLLILLVDDLHRLRGCVFDAVAEAVSNSASSRVRIVATAATGGGSKEVSGLIDFDRIIQLGRP